MAQDGVSALIIICVGHHNFIRKGAMNPEPLLDSRAKIERTITQIEELKNGIKAFFESNPYEVRADLDPDGVSQVWKFRLSKKPPRLLSVMTGEILHNLRSPLDQVCCAIAVLNGASETAVAFPIGQTLQEFETALDKQKKLPADARALIAAAKPYAGGNDLLYALHVLNKRDKHRVGLVPIEMPAETTASYIIFWEGLPFTIGSRKGQHLRCEEVISNRPTLAELSKKSKPLAFWDARPGHLIFGRAGDPGDESLEFMTTIPGSVFEADFYPTFEIGFSKVGLEGQPVVAVLNQMRDLVEGLLLTFERRFFS